MNSFKSSIGLGTAAFGECYGVLDFEECKKMVNHAMKNNINYFDTSQWYGNGRSEIILGKILKEYNRDSFIISTKVGRSSPVISEMFDFSYESIKRSTDESLKRLGLDCVDILFAHDVEFAPDPNLIVKETIPALNDIKNMRKTKYIGIAGYSLSYLRDVIMSSIIELDFVITYSRYVIFDESLNEYLPFFKSRNIFVINGSPTAMGLLTESNPPRWHPAKDSLKNACKKASFEFKKNNLNISEISIKYALKNKGINILLIGPKNLNELKNCMEAGMSELSLNQEEIFFKIKKEYFDILEYSEKSWEELEVKEYRRKLKNQK